MNLNKFFNDIFNQQCVITHHAVDRIKERFIYREMRQVRLLIQSGLRKRPLDTWSQKTAIFDERCEIGVVFSYEKGVVSVITLVRGKYYNDCEIIKASIKKEEADQDIEMLKSSLKSNKINF